MFTILTTAVDETENDRQHTITKVWHYTLQSAIEEGKSMVILRARTEDGVNILAR